MNINGIIKIAKDDDGTISESEEKAAKAANSTTGGSSGAVNSNGGSGSGAPTGGSSGSGTTTGTGGVSGGTNTGGGGGSSGGNPPTTGGGGTSTSVPFRTSIISFTLTNTSPPYSRFGGGGLLGGIVTCKRDHSFSAQVKATSGSGRATLRWSVDGGPLKDPVEIGFDYQGQTHTAPYYLTTTTSGNHTLRAYISDAVQNTITFNHSC